MRRAFGLLAFCCAAAVMWRVSAAAQQPTFSSRLEAVRVDVSVTERGVPVKGLTAADFEVFDNGVRQEVNLVASEDIPIDLVMALDMSGSVSGARLDHLRSASQVALDALERGDRAALLTFNHHVALRAGLTGNLTAIGRALDQNLAPGNTSMIDAAFAALVQADSGEGRGLVIVLSDGVDTSSWLSPESVIETAKRLDVVLFGISTGAPRRVALDELANASGGELIRIESTRELAVTLDRLLAAFRQRYLLSFVPHGVKRGGWHKLEVRTKRRGVTTKARVGYFGS